MSLSNKDTILVGFSQGTMMGLYLTLIQHHEPFYAMIGFSGRLIPPPECKNKSTPICLIHGERDDIVAVEELTLQHKPKLIIAGYSCYPRALDFKRFREIADKVGAYFMADIAHIAGLIATGAHENPFPYAHVATSTTHKTLRGPRGGIILSNYEDLGKKFNSALFPGIQGGPLMHVIAATRSFLKQR